MLERPEQISQYFLLEFDDAKRYHLQWADWLNAMGWASAKPKGVLWFNQYDQLIQAALGGQGIALGRLELLGTILAEHRLVSLSSPRTVGNEYAHWLIRGETDPREDVLDVIGWIHSQAAEMDIGTT